MNQYELISDEKTNEDEDMDDLDEESLLSMSTGGVRRKFYANNCTGIGIYVGILSALCYAFCALFVKLLTNHVNPIVITLVRSIIVFAMSALLMAATAQKFWIFTKTEYFVIVLLGLIDASVTVCQYFAFQMLNLSDALVLFACSPILIAIINCAIFCQKCDRTLFLTVTGCAIGIFLSVRPHIIFGPSEDLSADEAISGYLFALGASIGWVVTFLLSRFINKVPIFAFSSLQAVASTFFTGIYIISCNRKYMEFPVDYIDIAYVLIASILSFGAIYFIILALKFDSALMVSGGRSFDIIIGFLLDIFIFGVHPDWVGLAGILMVFLAITASAIWKGTKEKASLKKHTALYSLNKE